MTSTRKNRKEKTAQAYFVAAGIPLLALAAAALGAHGLQVHRDRATLERANTLINKGFGALASEEFETRRGAWAKTDSGCQALLKAYLQARRFDRVEWAAQACLDSGHESPEAYLGLATVQQAAGHEQVALQLLHAVESKFDKIPDIYYAIAQLDRRAKQDGEALQYYGKALEKAPQNQQLALEVLDYAATTEHWDVAKSLAEKLKTAETDNPEVKLFIARALMKGGDAAGGQEVVAQAQQLLQKNPAMMAALQKRYADVLGGNAAEGARVPASKK